MKYFAILILKFYKKFISPQLYCSCKYIPTCSEYATSSIAKHGLVVGCVRSIWRLVRCNPLARGGYDPA
ncbi:MAG: membrane protein insertion efficiency factor YidD [Candidatus Omnitrophica bacterium]|nr:membrane protein insertion efficiency factor YidD [Candidatus Omnitrophota bacterium]